MKNKVKAIVLEGSSSKEIYLNADNVIEEALKILRIDELQGYYTFGKGYMMLWQGERKEETSVEITAFSGLSYPIFINSKVIIINENIGTGDAIDVDLEELKEYFNMSNSFWALVKVV